ncbi:MAG: phytanoyl-CoA dioxygenase family protein [Herpetosiphonaceae bacterium]|nr:phytanoyl-CoA dioxygenase family protein [Herpetosiphonaceae bacterium]
MDMQSTLAALGVDDDLLTAAERTALDRDGFLPLPGILSMAQVEAFRARLDELLAVEGDAAGKEVHQEVGTQRLSDLVNKGALFEVCFTQPRVLAAIAYVLKQPFKLSSLNARFALPGQGLQALHVDWKGPVAADDFFVCNSIWLLDDFTESNGATRVVPGSHLSAQVPKDVMTDPSAPHPAEAKLIAPSGTVVIFNSHTWHGGTLNSSSKPRRALHSYFCRRDQPQQLDQQAYIKPDTYARLTPAARYVLDV